MGNRDTAVQMGRMLLKHDYLGTQQKPRTILSHEGMFYALSTFLCSILLLSFMILGLVASYVKVCCKLFGIWNVSSCVLPQSKYLVKRNKLCTQEKTT